MKKLVTSVITLSICAFSASSVLAQQPESDKVEVNIEITKDGKTETIVREFEMPSGENMVWDFDTEESEDGKVIVRKHVSSKDLNGMDWKAFHENVETKKVAFLGVKGYTINEDSDGPKNVRIMKVIEGEPAEAGGLKNEDIIKSIGGNEITTYEELVEDIRARQPGEKVEVVVDRNGSSKKLQVTLGEKEVKDWSNFKGMDHFKNFDGLENVEIRIEKRSAGLSKDDEKVIEKATGLNPADASKFDEVDMEIFPNPAEDRISYKLNVGEAGKMEMMLMDSSGKVLESKTLKSDSGEYQGEINLQERPAGSYLLVFKQGDKLISEKLMKK